MLRRAAAVWQGMKQLYGTAFVTIHGATPNALWVEQIEKFTDEQCRAGLSRLASEERSYPANLTEFVAACTHGPNRGRYLGRPTTVDELYRLAPPRAQPEKVRERLDRIRAQLRGQGRMRHDEA